MTDTALKRGSAVGATSIVISVFPIPDGAIDTRQDRQQTAGSYRVTAGDAVAPVFTFGPSNGSTGDTFIGVQATVTDDNPTITFYGVVLADAATAPSAAQIAAGTDSTDAAVTNDNASTEVSGSTLSLSFGGLTAETAYDVYYVAKDLFDNFTTPAKLDITTTATPAPSASRDMTYNLSTGVAQNILEDL